MTKIFVALFGALGISTAQAQTTVAGSTAGSFRVSESGAAEYRVPIQIPPGIAGMEPKLAITYNSQGRNGPLGVGWNLEGLSVIGRCPRTMAQDGARGSVNYDANDRYCLDGQRLIAISGAYGANGTEYRTERETFTKVLSYGAAGNGPASFVAWTKSGQIIEYGNTADSRIEAQGRATVRVWAVNKISDTKGNYLTVSYAENAAIGEYLPSRIDYTGNSAASQQPTASVQFEYEARADAVETNIAGSRAGVYARMKRIKTFVGGNAVREYRITYSNGAATARSRVASIAECIEGGLTCLAPIALTWSEPSVGAQSWTWANGHGVGDLGWEIADLFGDGRKAYYTHSSNGCHYASRPNADGTIQSWTWCGGHGVGDLGWRMADLFGDGRQVYYTHSSNGCHYATRLNADGGLQNYSWCGGHGLADLGWDMADLFGEGRQIYYTHGSNGCHYATRLNADGGLQNFGWCGGHGAADLGYQTADLFGEGRQLYYTHGSNGCHYATRLNEDGSLQNFGWCGGHGLGNGGWRMADLFGDGRQVYHTRTDATHYATRLNSDGSLQNWTWSGHGSGDLGTRMADLFGDGRQVYHTNSSDGCHYATRLNADGTSQSFTWCGGHGLGNGGLQMADFFGDGRQLYYTRNDTTHYATRFVSAAPDLLSTITAGAGATISIAYLPLTDGALYSKENTSTYPLRDLQIPLYVVATASSTNGVGGTSSQSYSYGGLKADASGRGNLGLRWLQSTDAQTGLKARSEFRQDWPYVGLQSLVKKTQSSGALLSQKMNTFGCANPASGGACTVAPGNRYFAFLSQSVETGSDLNGAALPTVTTTSSGFDLYGNVGTVSVSTGDGYSKTTTNIYANDVPNWRLGRLTRSSVTSTAP